MKRYLRFLTAGLAAVLFLFACDTGLNPSDDSGGDEPAPVTNAPATPTGLTVGSATESTLAVSWSASTGATAYEVHRSDSSGGTFTKVGSDVTGGTSFTDTGLSSSTTYYYKVLAKNSAGSSALSEEASGTTSAPAVVAPATPTGLTVGSATESTLAVSWSASTGATAYEVHRSDSSGGTFTKVGSDVTSGTSLTDTGLSSTTTYYYKVLAKNSAGSSALSSEVSGLTAPATPTGLAVGSATTTTLAVSWSASTGATAYEVYRSTTSGGTYAKVGSDVTSGTSLTDTGLTASTTYYYKVLAKNSGGSSALSAVVSGLTTPSTPTGLAVGSATTTTLAVSWSSVSGATAYEVYRSTTSGGTYAKVGSDVTSGTSLTDTGLSSTTTYYYKVLAKNSAGSSALSSDVSGLTAPATPTGLAVGSATTTTLAVSWSASTGATAYEVYRDSSSTGSFSTKVYSDTGASFTDSGLNSSTTYYYKVLAKNSAGSSALSSTVSGTTALAVPATPSGLTVGSMTEDSISLSWSYVDHADSYEIRRDTSSSGSFSTTAYDGPNSGCTVTGLSASTTYYFKVLAKNSAGSSAVSSAVSGTTTVASASLDTAFSGDGKVTTDISGSGANDEGYAMVIQSDGKIVVAGNASVSGVYTFALARYSDAGVLDSGFGTGGKVTTDISTGHDGAYAVAMDSSARIIVAGYTSSNNQDFALARYTTTGNLDTTFNSTGKVTTDFSSSSGDYAYAIAIQGDGKLVVAGSTGDGSTNDFAVARYDTSGSLDTSFDTDGKVTTAIGSNYDEAYAVAIQSDGKIVVAGRTSNGSDYDIALVRYNSDGSLDTSFGSGGKVITAIGSGHNQGYAVAIQSDGKILVAGSSSDNTGSPTDLVLLRYSTGGVLDTTFSSDGYVSTPVGSHNDDGYAITVAADGKIIVAGSAWNGSHNDFALACYNADGSLDTGFDDDGTAFSAIGSGTDDKARAVAIQPDGKIVVAGVSGVDANGDYDYEYDFAVARYNP